MKRFICLYLLLFFAAKAIAQELVSFDQVTYKAPVNWKFADNGSYRTYTIVNNAANTFCIISIYNSDVSSSNADQDFRKAWTQIVAGHFTVIKNLNPQQNKTVNGISYLQDEANVANNKASFFVRLLMFDLKEKTQAVLFLSANKNSLNQYQPDFDNFLASLKPGNTDYTLKQNGFNNTTANTASSNFNDGWMATTKEDYVLLTKNNSKVLLYYPEQFTDESRANTVDYFYSHQLSKEYTITNTTARSDYNKYVIEGDAKENSTGKKCYVVMDVVAQNGTAKTVMEIAPTLEQLKSEIGIDFEKMLTYNRFGVSLQNIAGTWKGGSGSSQSYYYAYTGNYAGTNTVVMSNKFMFNSNGSYEAEFKGGTGMVGNMKFYQEHEKGSITVLSPWQISTTNQANKTVVYDCWLEAVKGGMILHLINHQYTGDTFDLVREK